MTQFVMILAFGIICFVGGWYCKGKFGAKAAADLQAVKDAAGKIS